MGFTLEDLGLAYRKAKVDLYYSTTPSLFAIADYEDKLQVNLTDLQERINGEDQDWIHNPDFLGGWSLVPKAIKTEKTDDSTGLIFASPDDEWQKIIEAVKEVTAEFRLMACCSLDFHVLSALWMLKVGSFFDKKHFFYQVYLYQNFRFRKMQKSSFRFLIKISFWPKHLPIHFSNL